MFGMKEKKNYTKKLDVRFLIRDCTNCLFFSPIKVNNLIIFHLICCNQNVHQIPVSERKFNVVGTKKFVCPSPNFTFLIEI